MRISANRFGRSTPFFVGIFLFTAVLSARAGTPAQIFIGPSSQTAGVGAFVDFLVIPTGDPTILYQWSFNGTNIPGATGQFLGIPSVQTSNQGSYQVVVTNNYGSATSAVAYLQVVLTPAVASYSASSSVTEGSTASFSVVTTGQPPMTFQWDFDGAAIAGATNSALNIPNAQATNSGSYQVFITNGYGNTSSPILPLTVAVPPVVSGTTSSGPAALGDTATFTVFVQGAAPLMFQWYFEPSNGLSTNAILNATNSILTISNVQASDAGSYQLFVTNSFGNTNSQPLPLQIVLGTQPSISGQPTSQTVPQGFLATFQVRVSGTAPFTYQWWYDSNAIAGATNSSLPLLNVQSSNAGSYQVVVSNAVGAITSAMATLSVSSVPTQSPSVTLTPLLSFLSATNGSQPESSVTSGTDGYLYVTTASGGTNGAGTVSQMDTNGNVLWTTSLSQTTGTNPEAGLVQGGGSVFYGTTVNGGGGFGTVFSITSSGVMTPLYSFTNGVDGANPQAALTLGSDGYLYGSTATGGTNDVGGGGDGTLFKMTTNGVLVWSISLNGTNGRTPESALVQNTNGILYGTTTAGGANNLSGGGVGTVFSLTTNGVFTSLYSFTGGADGSVPEGGLAIGPDGGLYGTTSGGGNTTLNSGLGFGSVFDITTNGSLTTLATFSGTNGVSPEGALTLGSDDNFYGTTSGGGVDFPDEGYGTIFRVSMNGELASLLSFDGGSDGAYPTAGLTQTAPLTFYGTTSEGGTNNVGNGGDGSLFEFTTPAGPPGLANEGTQVLQIGDSLIFTNQSFGGTPPISFALDANEPGGVNLTTNGIFSWAPDCAQGSTTNLVTVWAIDSSSPPVSNAMTFTVILGQCAEVSIGSGPVQIGGSICVPVNLFSTGPLTNLSFTIQTLTNRFTNWTITPVNSALASATVQDADPSQPQFNLAAQTGQSLIGTTLLAYVCVQVFDSGHSAFAHLAPTDFAAQSPATLLDVPTYGQDGVLELIEGHPLLSGNLVIGLASNGTPQLTLFGNPGTNYYIAYTTSLLPPVTWVTFTNFTLPGIELQTNFYQASPTDPVEFFRAYFVGTVDQ